MRKLTFFLLLLILAAIAWGVFWIFGARTVENVMNDWLAERRAEGWVAEASALETRGFPNRFDTTFEGLELADPDTEVGWSAPAFQLLSLSYKPNHVIAVWPGQQTFSTPDASYTMSAETMRGSIIISPSLSLETQSSTIEIAAASVTSTKGWTADLGSGQISMRARPDAAQAHTYDLYFTFSELDPGDAFLAPLKGVAGLPRVIDAVSMTATGSFDKAWDLSAVEVARPQLRALTINQITARWGDLLLVGGGALEVSVDGTPTGDLEFEATNWRDMVDIAEATGAITPDAARGITRALSLMANLSGDPEQLDLTVSFRRGVMFLGPIPVGAAPDMGLP